MHCRCLYFFDFFEQKLAKIYRRVIKVLTKQLPAVVLTGQRQSGKTTLLKQLFSKTHGYVSLELPDVRAAAMSDPRGFLDMHTPPVIFDEIQYAPIQLPYIKESSDQNR